MLRRFGVGSWYRIHDDVRGHQIPVGYKGYRTKTDKPVCISLLRSNELQGIVYIGYTVPVHIQPVVPI